MELTSTLAATLLSNGSLKGQLASVPSRRSETPPSAVVNARSPCSPAATTAAATAGGGVQLQAAVVPSVSCYLQDSVAPSADVFAIVRRGGGAVAGGLQSLVAVGGVMQQRMQSHDGLSLLPGDTQVSGEGWVGGLQFIGGRLAASCSAVPGGDVPAAEGCAGGRSE